MRITLIRVPETVPAGSNALTTPPLGVAYLAAALREAGREPAVIDGVGEAITSYTPAPFGSGSLYLHGLTLDEIVCRTLAEAPDLIGVSCMFSQDWPVARQLMTDLKRALPRVKVVCGGEHFTAVPEFSMESCPAIDYGVQGEGEQPMLALIQALESGRTAESELQECLGLVYRNQSGEPIRAKGRPQRMKSLENLAWPAWDLVPIEAYLQAGCGFGIRRGRTMPIMASRGCPYACTFCSNSNMWTQRWVPRPVLDVVSEIEHYQQVYGTNNFDFYDLTAIVRKQWILDFAAEIKRRNLQVTYQLPSGTRSEAIDYEVAKALRDSGCCHLVYAPESGSQRVLKIVKKKVSLSRMLQSMSETIRAGMTVKMNIVVGFPDERPSDLLRTLWFFVRAAAVGVHDVFIYTFTPYPGSELFRRLQKEGKIEQLHDHYFERLTAYISISDACSYSDFLSDRTLRWFKVCGMSVFYGLSFLMRPWRVFRLIRNVRRDRPETRLEQFVSSWAHTSKVSGLVYFRSREKHGAAADRRAG